MYQIPIKDARLHVVFKFACARAPFHLYWQGENLDLGLWLGWGTNLIFRNVTSSEIIKGTGSNGGKAEVKLPNSLQNTYQPPWLPPFKGAGPVGNTVYKKLKAFVSEPCVLLPVWSPLGWAIWGRIFRLSLWADEPLQANPLLLTPGLMEVFIWNSEGSECGFLSSSPGASWFGPSTGCVLDCMYLLPFPHKHNSWADLEAGNCCVCPQCVSPVYTPYLSLFPQMAPSAWTQWPYWYIWYKGLYNLSRNSLTWLEPGLLKRITA